ncbi:MAG TPA: hypothetical protein VK866_02810 [Acidimicrobiales bacterium]|nr:hypothetical protein [Acidimicrobiales bacterium]
MSPAMFLVLALVVAAVGIAIVVIRHRRPSSLGSGMERFAREMQALAPRDRSGPEPDDE